ncbi:MAG: DNA topoisomerase IV subunit A [Planctomycetes bacterium]|nr:DNA topoisomerase IV subunit A [Planctomycetota bacterium]
MAERKKAGGPSRITGKEIVKRMEDSAGGVYGKIMKHKHPEITFPVRALSNVTYDPKVGYFEIRGETVSRTLHYNTVKTFAQTMRMMGMSKELIRTDDFATKRDAYYMSKNWEEARFDEQVESDTVMDDLEAHFMVNREQLGFVPDEHGGQVAGELVVIDRDRETGRRLEIDCTRFGSGAYAVPPTVEHLEFKTSAKFVLAIETGGIFQRLAAHNFWRKAKCILVSMGGVPTRACRRFIRRLSESNRMPVYAFVDCDPYGISNIYRTLKVGSGNAAHINQYFCVPHATYLGVTPQDIKDYSLPTHPLKEVDIKRADDALKNDPFFQHYKPWQDAMKMLLAMGVRAEQQAFSKHTLSYVMDEYLPRKLKHTEKFLP